MMLSSRLAGCSRRVGSGQQSKVSLSGGLSWGCVLVYTRVCDRCTDNRIWAGWAKMAFVCRLDWRPGQLDRYVYCSCEFGLTIA